MLGIRGSPNGICHAMRQSISERGNSHESTHHSIERTVVSHKLEDRERLARQRAIFMRDCTAYRTPQNILAPAPEVH